MHSRPRSFKEALKDEGKKKFIEKKVLFFKSNFCFRLPLQSVIVI